MIFTLRRLVVIVGLFIVVLIGWRSYNYFFDKTKPVLMIKGIESDMCYGGDVPCLVNVSKKGDLYVWLDNKLIISKFRIRSRFETTLPIPTKTIPNGRHSLKIEMTDNTYNKNSATYECDFVVDNLPLQAALIHVGSDNKVFQGRTLHIQIQANKELKSCRVNALAAKFECFPEAEGSTIYECFIPVACEEAASEYPLHVEVVDKAGNTVYLDDKFQVMSYPFKKQVISVSDEKMKFEREVGLSATDLEAQLEKLTKASPTKKMWRGSFFVPLDLTRITCDFGVMRTSQERGKTSHRALDLIGPLHCLVWAPHDGIVVLKARYVYTGNTVIIDHGCGVLSMMGHLDSFADISVGDKIKRGSPVGIMGKTGYASGPHLHWEMRVNNIPIDPMQWTSAGF
jgi:hypothetical protein